MKCAECQTSLGDGHLVYPVLTAEGDWQDDPITGVPYVLPRFGEAHFCSETCAKAWFAKQASPVKADYLPS